MQNRFANKEQEKNISSNGSLFGWLPSEIKQRTNKQAAQQIKAIITDFSKLTSTKKYGIHGCEITPPFSMHYFLPLTESHLALVNNRKNIEIIDVSHAYSDNDSTLQYVKTLHGNTNEITDLIKLSGDLIATSNIDQKICLWDWRTGGCIKTLIHNTKGMSEYPHIKLALSSTGKLISAGNNQICIWNLSDYECKHVINISSRGGILVWATHNEKIVTFHQSSEKDELINEINIWSDQGKHLHKMIAPSWNVSFTPDDKIMIIDLENKMHIWDISADEPKEIRTINFNHIRVNSINTLIPLGNGLIAIPTLFPENTIEIWDYNKGELMAKHSALLHTNFHTPVSMPDGKLFAFNEGNETNEPIITFTFKVKTAENKCDINKIDIEPPTEFLVPTPQFSVEDLKSLWKNRQPLKELTVDHVDQKTDVIYFKG